MTTSETHYNEPFLYLFSSFDETMARIHKKQVKSPPKQIEKPVERKELTVEQKVKLNKEKKKQYKDVTGQRFGRLTCLKYVGHNEGRSALWLCKCDCGNEVVKCIYDMKKGRTNSCGCLRKEYDKSRKERK